MRGAFIRTLSELAAEDPRVLLLTGDLGYTVVESYAERFPARFFNVGVAEQNMVGLATGLAEAGFIPFVYSIATFMSLRAYEFIRNGPVLQQLPVRIVGVGGGFEYGTAGASHYALEDVGLMRLQPGLTVIVPADHRQATAAIRATWALPGPVFYRLGKDDRRIVPGLDGRFDLGRIELIRDGGDLLLVVMGAVASEAVAAAELLAARGVQSAVAVVPVLNPAPIDDLARHLVRHRVALSVEDHYAVGGVGSLVAEVIAERGIACRLVRCAVRSHSEGRSGSEAYMRRLNGLTRDGIAETALRARREIS